MWMSLLGRGRAELFDSPDPTINDAGLGMAGPGEVRDSRGLDADEAEDLFS